MAGVGDFVNLLRSVDRLLTLETKHGKAIEKLDAEIAELKARVTRLEARKISLSPRRKRQGAPPRPRSPLRPFQICRAALEDWKRVAMTSA
jgi:hypothetical protein